MMCLPPTSFAGPTGLVNRPSLGKHKQQYQAFQGWPYVAISAIAKRIAGRQLFVGRLTPNPSLSRNKAQWLKSVLPDRLKAVGDNIEPLESHPILDAVDDPNPAMVRWVLLYVTICSLELTGKAYLWLRDNGERIEVWPLPSHWVEPDHSNGLFSGWNVQPDGFAEPFPLQGHEVVYFALPDPKSPIVGSLSPLQSQAKAVNADDFIQEAQQRVFENGPFPTHAVIVGKEPHPDVPSGRRPRLSDSQQRQIISAVKKRYCGAHNAGEPVILDGLIENLIRLNSTPQELDFLNSGKQTKSRILQAFGVNPLIVGEIEGANRAQAVVAEQSFCSNVINPLLDLLGQVFTAKVAPVVDPSGERLVCWFEPAVASDPEMLLKRWQVGVQAGVVMANEVRVHLLNLPESRQLDGMVVGGQRTTNLIEQAIGEMVNGRLGEIGADRILELVEPDHRGNGRY
jgi:phage portal protein BeeE